MAGLWTYEKQAKHLFVWALTTSDPKLIRRLRECAFELLALAKSSDDDINRIIQQSWDHVHVVHKTIKHRTRRGKPKRFNRPSRTRKKIKQKSDGSPPQRSQRSGNIR
jgi:hypothetical protein